MRETDFIKQTWAIQRIQQKKKITRLLFSLSMILIFFKESIFKFNSFNSFNYPVLILIFVLDFRNFLDASMA